MITVAVLMPTLPGRETMRDGALQDYFNQQYPADWEVDLFADDRPKNEVTLGQKLNEMIEAHSADYYVLWDDDDHHSVSRVRRQVGPLLDGFDVSGTSQIYYHDIRATTSFRLGSGWRRWARTTLIRLTFRVFAGLATHARQRWRIRTLPDLKGCIERI